MTGVSRKPLYFIGSSQKDLQDMPDEVKDVFGVALLDAQYGDQPEGARPFGEGGSRNPGLVRRNQTETLSKLDSKQRRRTTRGTMAKTAKAKAKAKIGLQVHESSGNVFQDLGMRDAEERLAKAELARVVKTAISDRGLTQTEAAALLDVKQPDISDLIRGKLSRFSMDRLERFLNALDLEVRIQVGPRPRSKKHAGISVELVGSFR